MWKFWKKNKKILEFLKFGSVFFCTVKTFFQIFKKRVGRERATQTFFRPYSASDFGGNRTCSIFYNFLLIFMHSIIFPVTWKFSIMPSCDHLFVTNNQKVYFTQNRYLSELETEERLAMPSRHLHSAMWVTVHYSHHLTTQLWKVSILSKFNYDRVQKSVSMLLTRRFNYFPNWVSAVAPKRNPLQSYWGYPRYKLLWNCLQCHAHLKVYA